MQSFMMKATQLPGCWVSEVVKYRDGGQARVVRAFQQLGQDEGQGAHELALGAHEAHHPVADAWQLCVLCGNSDGCPRVLYNKTYLVRSRCCDSPWMYPCALAAVLCGHWQRPHLGKAADCHAALADEDSTKGGGQQQPQASPLVLQVCLL